MTDIVAKVRFDATDLEFTPITPDDAGMTVIRGDPQPRIHTLVQTDTIWSALSRVEPGEWTLAVSNPAALTFIEGEATLTVGGRTREVVAGDTVFFAAGTIAHWVLRTPLRDWFIMFGPFAD